MQITKELVEDILGKSYRKTKVLALNQCKGGDISAVYDIVCSNPEEDLILKIYPDDYHWKMEKEIYVYGLMNERIDIPVPRVLGHDDSKELMPRNYLLLSKVEGKIFTEIGSRLEQQDIHSLYVQLGDILRQIHTITFDRFGYIGTEILDPHPTNEAYMTFQFDKKLREYDELGGKGNIADRVRKCVEGNSQLLNHCQQACLCHNDYYEGNFIVQKGNGVWKVMGIIDVENALSGDALLDIAKLHFYAIKDDTNKQEGFLEGYGELPNDWQDRLQLYQVYHALELWDWFAKLKQEEPLDGLEKDILRFSNAE